MAAVQVIQSSHPRPTYDPRPNLKTKLCQEPFHIPNLRPLYKDWPDAVNANYPQLKVALEARIDSLYPPEKAAALKHGDYALMAAMSWPRAAAKRLQTCTFWLLWLFTWDDEIDQSTSELSGNLEKANNFREVSFHYTRYCTGVPTEDTYKFRFDINPPTSKLIRSLDVIGAALQEVYNKDQIMCFVNEIDYYMRCQQRDQGRKLAGKIPTVAEYWETRLGTSAVTCMLALYEYADGFDGRIPRYIMTSPKMVDLWREVNLNMALLADDKRSNDMLSLRKEIKHGDIDSIVPVLVHSRGMTVQQAITDTTKELQLNVDRFDQTATDLLAEVKSTSPDLTDEVASYITGCRYNLMANLLWSLQTPRYGLGDVPRDAEGGMTITV